MMDVLPDDVLRIILSCLPIDDVHACSGLSRQLLCTSEDSYQRTLISHSRWRLSQREAKHWQNILQPATTVAHVKKEETVSWRESFLICRAVDNLVASRWAIVFNYYGIEFEKSLKAGVTPKGLQNAMKKVGTRFPLDLLASFAQCNGQNELVSDMYFEGGRLGSLAECIQSYQDLCEGKLPMLVQNVQSELLEPRDCLPLTIPSTSSTYLICHLPTGRIYSSNGFNFASRASSWSTFLQMGV